MMARVSNQRLFDLTRVIIQLNQNEKRDSVSRIQSGFRAGFLRQLITINVSSTPENGVGPIVVSADTILIFSTGQNGILWLLKQ